MGGTAVVLGGGGAVGIGWQAGLLTGLAEGGCDLSGADLVVGTSAGALVGASSPAEPIRRRPCVRLPGWRRS
ncbi:patatin-like phospholipase family protein [Streptomyces sp. NPDC056464]|uniref:patatin-like phospholipase family protein n=1 Tax=Streptomyces sp. NPDC056464 TaxID=3345828 RepID=UPI003673DB76